MKDKIAWLFQQLPEWVEAGGIDDQHAGWIRQRYQDKLASGTGAPKLSVVLPALAALMVGVGIIMLVSWNWHELGRQARVVLAFVPWLLSSALLVWALFFTRTHARAWTESCALLQSLGIGASLAIVALLYPSGGDISNLLLLWTVLQLLPLYLTRSTAALIIYLAILIWRVSADPHAADIWLFLLAGLPALHITRSTPASLVWLIALTICLTWGGPPSSLADYGDLIRSIWFWLLLALWLPFFFARIRELQQQGSRLIPVHLWSLVLVVLVGILWQMDDHPALAISAIAFYLASCISLNQVVFARYTQHLGTGVRHCPFLLFGVAGTAVTALIYSHPGILERIWTTEDYSDVPATSFAVLVLLALSWAFLTCRQIQAEGFRFAHLMVFPLVIALGMAIMPAYGWLLPGLLLNLYLAFGICIWWIVQGAFSLRAALVNWGLMILTAQILMRAFDAGFGILPTSIALILCGLLMLVLNLVLIKKRQEAV